MVHRGAVKRDQVVRVVPLFFVSSRRRHTSYIGDWSSDVCSSDLLVLCGGQPLYVEAYPLTEYSMYGAVPLRTIKKTLLDLKGEGRSEERRVGKEGSRNTPIPLSRDNGPSWCGQTRPGRPSSSPLFCFKQKTAYELHR